MKHCSLARSDARPLGFCAAALGGVELIALVALVALVALSACAGRGVADPRAPEEMALPRATAVPCNSRAQLLVTSFDGLPNSELLDFARNRPVRFTFFVSGVYFVTDSEGREYRAPGRGPGQSRLGFGGSEETAARNRALVLEALALGHEAGSHLNGHFSGAAYSRAHWQLEMRYFEAHTRPWMRHRYPDFVVQGFRAPGLATSPGLAPALREFRFRYSSNTFDARSSRPRSASGGLYELPISVVRLLDGRRNILAMDYNLQVIHSSTGRRLPRARYEDTLAAYRRLLESRLAGTREPIHLAHHTGPVVALEYRRALLDFLAPACGREDVYCVSCAELLRWHERCSSIGKNSS